MKDTCLSIYSSAVNAEAPLGEVLVRRFPWCAEWEAELQALFAAYVEAKQKQNVLDYDDLLLYWAHMMAEGSSPRTFPNASITCWSTNTKTPIGCRLQFCSRSSRTGAA